MERQHGPQNALNAIGGVSKDTNSCEAAFTLIELLVTIAIIVILIALAMPAAQRMRESGNIGKCIGNQRQILIGLTLYCSDNSGKLPPTVNLQTGETWGNLIAPYLDEKYAGKEFMRCPSSKKTDVETYGVNYGEAWEWRVFGLGPPGYNGMPDSKLLGQLPGNAILFADLSDKGGGPGGFLSPYAWPLNNDNNKDGIPDSCGAMLSRGPYNFVAFRHLGNTAIVGLANGSVKKITIAEWQGNDNGLWGQKP